MERSRTWSFTLNNYTDDDEQFIVNLEQNKQVKYLICGKEVGAEGTHHLQGYIYFHNQKTFDQTKKFLGSRYHIEKCKGSFAENVSYCSKDGEYVEFGEPPKQGSREDIKNVKQQMESGVPINQIVLNATSYQSARHAELMFKYQVMPPAKKREIRWYWGPSGTGKTRKAFEESGDDVYLTMKDLKWWDGYYGQRCVVIDDFRKDFCTFHELLRILDRYPYRVQFKGGSMWLQPSTEVIIITSCYPPADVYNTREDVTQLIRRIDEIREFKK